MKKRERRSERKIFLIIVFIFLIPVISSASDYRFQNTSGTNLTVIHGDTGNLTVFGNISAANFNYSLFVSTYNATYDAKFSGANIQSWKIGTGIIYNDTSNVKVGIGTATPITIFHVNNTNSSLNASYFYQNVTSLTIQAYTGKFESFVDGVSAAGGLVYLGYFGKGYDVTNRDYAIYSTKGVNYFENLTYFNDTVRILSGNKLGIGVNSSDALYSELTIKVNTTQESAPAETKFIYFGIVNGSALGHNIYAGLSFNVDPRKGYYHFSGNASNLYINVPNNTVTGEIYFSLNSTSLATLNNTVFKVNRTIAGGSKNERSGRVVWCNAETGSSTSGGPYNNGDKCCAFYMMKCKEVWLHYNYFTGGGGGRQIRPGLSCAGYSGGGGPGVAWEDKVAFPAPEVTTDDRFIALCY